MSLSIDVFIGLCHAIDRIALGQIPNANEWHNKIKNWYSWSWVAKHTEIVYNHVMTQKAINLKERIQKYVEYCIKITFSKNKRYYSLLIFLL